MLLKQLLIFTILFSFAVTLNAQVTRKGMKPIERGPGVKTRKADFSLDQLQGKWQEYERIDRQNNSVAFTDTLLLNFKDSNKVETRISTSNRMSMNGTADIDDDNLTAASDTYTIKSFAKNVLVLDDDNEYIHRFKKVDIFWHETLGKTSIQQQAYNEPVNVSLEKILAKWSVYKRAAKPGAITNNMALIKYLNITTKKNDSTATGDLTFYQGQVSQQLPCTVILNGSDIKIIAGQNTWNLSIFQADGTDFIFGNAGLLYFSKTDK